MAIFLKLGDKFKGKVVVEGYEDWIQASSIGLGAGRAISQEVGSGEERAVSKPSISEISVSRESDKSTPLLFTEATVGQALPEVKVNFVDVQDPIHCYMEFKLQKVMVSSWSLNSSGEVPTEQFTLSFTNIEISFNPVSADDSAGQPVKSGYDLLTGRAS